MNQKPRHNKKMNLKEKFIGLISSQFFLKMAELLEIVVCWDKGKL